MIMSKKDSTKQPKNQGFEVQPGEDNANIPTEDAVMVDDQPELEQPKAKGISLYIDLEHDPEKEPEKSQTTAVSFALNNTQITLDTIATQIEEFDKIVINGFLDKKNYEAVKKAKSVLLKTRTTLNKVAKAETIDPINEWLDQYKGKLKEFSNALLVGQEKMEAKLKEIDDAFALEEKRKEEEAQARIQGRVSGLSNLGSVFNAENGTYTFPYDAGLLINSLQLKDWEDEEYNAFIDDVVTAWNAEQTRLQQIQDAEDKEKERILTLGSQLTDREKAIQEKQIKLRTKELTLTGAEQNGKTWTYNDQTVHSDDIANLDDDAWDELMVRLTAEPEPPIVHWPAPAAGEESDMAITMMQDNAQQVGDSPADVVNEAPYLGGEAAPFEVEIADDDIEGIPDENFPTPADDDMESGIQKTLYFDEERPFIDHIFIKSILRIYPVEYELEANEGISSSDLFDAGDLADTDLKFLFIKRPK